MIEDIGMETTEAAERRGDDIVMDKTGWVETTGLIQKAGW